MPSRPKAGSKRGWNMLAPQKIVDAALALSKEERLDLIQQLLHSVDHEQDVDWTNWDPEFRDELIEECHRRWAEYERGATMPISHETVMEEIKARLST